MSMLKTDSIVMRFGGVTAVNSLSLEVNQGEIVALIGPNGAGKTTAFNIITGVYTPTSGRVLFDGHADITGKAPDKIAKLGIARTFQNIRLFKNLTVFENVLIAKHLHIKADFVSSALGVLPFMDFLPAAREEKAFCKDTEKLLKRLNLWDLQGEIASSLPYGKQRHLEIARALATSPKLLLLDEPAAGMNPQETWELGDFITDIRRDFDLTVLIIEHHMDLVMEISNRIYVLDFGQLIAEGTPQLIQNDHRVIEAYLGVEAHA